MAGQNWRKNKKGFMVNSEGKTARQVKQEKYAAKKAEAKASGTSSLSVSGGGGEAPARGRSRLGKLIDSIEANQKADVQNYRSVLKVADKANAMASGKPGGQPTAKQDATRSQLPGTAEKKGRFSKAVSDLEAIDKADLKNAAKTYGATAALMGAAKKSTEEKTAKGLSEGKTKLLQKASEGKTPAKPANKGSEEVKTEWGGSIAELKQKDRNPLNQLIDTKAVAPKNPVSRYNKQEIEDLAQKLAKGETSQLNPVLVRKVGFEKYEVVRGDKEFYAAQRARELNPGLESVETFSVKPNEIKAAKRQLSLFKGEKNQVSAVVRDRFQIDLADIDSSVKGNQVPLSAQAKSLLEVGANLVPVVLRKKKGGRFEVVSGHQVYHAAMAAKKRDRTFEVVNAVIID